MFNANDACRVRMKAQELPRAFMRTRVLRRGLVLSLINNDGNDDDASLDNDLKERRDAEKVKTVVDDTDQQCADDCPPNLSDTTLETRSADDDRGNRIKLDSRSQRRVS